MAGRCLLYYITDRNQFAGSERSRRDALLCKIVEAAQAGVDYIQLREKDLITCELESLARVAVGLITQLRTENRELRTKLLINSRTDIALAVGADGVHLPSEDNSPVEVRMIWSKCGAGALAREKPVVTVACHSAADVKHAASEAAADLAIFAPVFEKKARPGTQPAGLSALHEACQAKIPVLARRHSLVSGE